jgi:hypothetical protein
LQPKETVVKTSFSQLQESLCDRLVYSPLFNTESIATAVIFVTMVAAVAFVSRIVMMLSPHILS